MEPRTLRTRQLVNYEELELIFTTDYDEFVPTPTLSPSEMDTAPSSEEQMFSIEQGQMLAQCEPEVNAKIEGPSFQPGDREMKATMPKCKEPDSHGEDIDDDDVSEDDAVVDPDQRWTFLLEAATKTVTVQVGHGLLSNRYVVEQYGSDVASALRGEWVIPETTLKSIPTLFAAARRMKREIKSEHGFLVPERTKVIALPDILPQVFAELLRWLQSRTVCPPLYVPLKAWKDYYAPILPEDIAVAICEFGAMYGIKQFHNCGIDMLSDLFETQELDNSIGSFARKVAARKGVERCVSKFLIMLWALHDLKAKTANMRHLDECESSIMRTYVEQHHKVMKRNEKIPLMQVKKWRLPLLKDYYL